MLATAPAWADEVVTLTGLGVRAQLDIHALPAERGARFDGGSGEIDTRLWLGRSGRPFSVGLGALTGQTSTGAPLDPGARTHNGSSLMLGLRYDFADGARLTFGSTTGSPSFGDAGPERNMRLGLDLKPARNPKRFSRGTLFRAQLDQSTQLSLRVRSRGLRLVLRSEF